MVKKTRNTNKSLDGWMNGRWIDRKVDRYKFRSK